MAKTIIDLVFVEPWPFWAGGIVIGLHVPLLYYFYNIGLGVSIGYGNLVTIIFRPHKLKWIQDTFANAWDWRLYFILGITLGGFVSARLSGMPLIIEDMGQFTKIVDWPLGLLALYFFSGGALLGIGARLARGCTSGQSIHGLSNFQLPSLIVTIMFLIGGLIAANLVRIFVMGGGI